jgi:hypothetical protein
MCKSPVNVPPDKGKAPISAKDQDTFAEPFTDFPVLPIVNVLAVPQYEVVMFALPSNETPFIVLAVSNIVAVSAYIPFFL